MITNTINGKNILYMVKKKISIYVKNVSYFRSPNVAIIILGENTASKIYVYENNRLFKTI